MITFEEIQKEFDELTTTFEAEKAATIEDETLHTMLAKHPLYEIEPYFMEHNNEFMDENSPSYLIGSEDDYDPKNDQLYELKVNLEDRKVYFRTEIFGGGVSYDTVFSYSNECYRSATIYINPEMKKAIKLAYLFFKDGLPFQYVEIGKYGALSKKYTSEDGRLSGYLQEYDGHDIRYEALFSYNHDGALASIIGREPGTAKETLLFKRPEKNENIEDTLETIENLLVEAIADQIQEKVKIPEQVYCILLEYNMQGAFPPTVGIGVLSDIDGDINDRELYEIYNAPDMQYFSEDGNLDIDLYTPELEEAYLFYNRTYNIDKVPEQHYAAWEEQIKAIYLRVCKRLTHFDFSASFSKTENFLVVAKDFEECNEEFYHQEMLAYKTSGKWEVGSRK